MKCQYDTGSMYGCQPACSAPVTVTATYQPPCYPPITMLLCARHISPMAGRVHPATLTTTPKGK